MGSPSATNGVTNASLTVSGCGLSAVGSFLGFRRHRRKRRHELGLPLTACTGAGSSPALAGGGTIAELSFPRSLMSREYRASALPHLRKQLRQSIGTCGRRRPWVRWGRRSSSNRLPIRIAGDARASGGHSRHHVAARQRLTRDALCLRSRATRSGVSARAARGGPPSLQRSHFHRLRPSPYAESGSSPSARMRESPIWTRV